jgi:hypothetical protein
LPQITVRYDYQSLDKVVQVQSSTRGPLHLPAVGFINTVPTFSSLALYLKGNFHGWLPMLLARLVDAAAC